MHPILFDIGPVTLYTYGLMIALGILMAVVIVRYESRRKGLNPEKLTDLAFYLVIAGKYKDAETAYSKALNHQRRALPSSDILILKTRRGHATVLRNLGETKPALSIYQAVLVLQQEHLGMA